MFDTAALRVQCPEIEPPNTRVRNRSRTHGAGFQRHIKVASRQPLRTEHFAGASYSQNFRVSRRIVRRKGLIACPRDHSAITNDHSPNGHLATARGLFGVFQRQIHKSGFRLDHRFNREGNAVGDAMAPHPKKDKPAMVEKPAGERIAKRMARAGLCSRRDAERWIAEGRVSVNGRKLETPACIVGPADAIEVDGAPLPDAERTRLWLYHKPSGKVTTHRDPDGRETVFDALPNDLPRVLSIGRLDINTEGLLLLTNDGGLARVLELPTTGWLRRYRVRAHGQVTQDQLDGLKEGVAVDGVLYGAIDAEIERQQGTNTWITFAMREGKNREVKNVLASLGLTVNRLIRVSYGPFQLGDLGVGKLREIRGRMLRDQLGPRLIEAAGARFDLPEAAKKETKPGEAKPKHKAKRPPRNRKSETQSALDRLSTRPDEKGPAKSRPGGRKPARGKDHADRRR